ncbi:OsmC-related (seleno)protein [Roseovarius sp.]|uniref:OsmC-related (seleno)protein n=1 Tax=Roseovarius sp. TaxID=1486281 RepID=UPI00356A5478
MSVEVKSFDVIFECDAHNAGGMRTDMAVRMVKPDLMEFALASDEGSFHGGGGTAPPPLTYFAAGLASCLMTQLRAFSKRLRIEVGEMKISTRCHWQGEQTGREPYVTAPVGFDLDIEIGTDAPLEEQLRLIETAKKGCFIEQTLVRENIIAHRLKVGEDWHDV